MKRNIRLCPTFFDGVGGVYDSYHSPPLEGDQDALTSLLNSGDLCLYMEAMFYKYTQHVTN